MAQPRDYTRQYNFNDFQTTNPDDPLPGPQVDGELDAVKLTLDDLNANIGKIQRDDGKLKNASVHKDSFSQDALAIVNSDFTPRGDWSTATAYAVNDAVDFNGATYVATVAHTSSAAFSTDDAADRWILIANAAISGTGSAVDKFEGDGSTTSFTLTYTYQSETAVQVFVNGELLNPVDDYTISGNTLTLYTAPGLPTVAGNENVIVWGASVVAQAAAQDASGHESNASGFADEAEDWATQTTGIVESTDYSSKAYAIGGTGVDSGAGSAKDWATKTSGTVGNTTEYSSKYWATQGNVPIVANNIADINTVAGISSNVTAVANNETNVNTVAGIDGNVTTVAGISANVTTVANNDANVTTLAGLNTQITTLGAISTDISTVSGISANTTTVAGISSDVTTAAGISSNITTVAGISSNVTTVALANANVTTIATDLTGTNTIGTTAGSIANVNIVANAIANVNSTAQNIADVNTVATEINNNNLQTVANDIQAVITTANDLNEATSEIDTVANSIANVDLVGGSISNVNTVAANLTDVNAFFDTYFIGATAPSSPTTGDLWFDTTSSTMKVYSGSGFINAGSSVNGTAARFVYTATAGQATFTGADDGNNTLAYDAGFVDIYMNGVKLAPADYTASNGTSIVLASGAALNDVIEIVAYGTFTLANLSLSDLTDVSTSGRSDHDILAYNVANQQFEARSTAVLTGLTMQGNAYLRDNDAVYFGTSLDSYIYHDGASGHTYFRETGSGSLIMQASTFVVQNAAGTQNIIMAPEGTNGIDFSYNGSVKLGTSHIGIDVRDSVTNEPTITLKTATPANFMSIARDSSTGHYNFTSEETGSSINFLTDEAGSGAETRMTIDRYGTVGIGTSSTSTNYGAYKTPLIVERSSGYGYVEIRSGSTANQAGLILNRQGNTGWLHAMDNNGKLKIAPMASINEAGLTNAKDGSTGITVDTSGRVGIGTTLPGDKLTVSGADAYMLIDRNNGEAGATFRYNADNTKRADIAVQTNGDLRIKTNLTERMRIGSSGDVGIGNSNPQRKLVVSENGANGIEIDPNISGQSEIISYNRSNSQYTPLNVAASSILLNDCVGVGSTNPTSNAQRLHVRHLAGTDTSLPTVKIERANNAGGGAGNDEIGLEVNVPSSYNNSNYVYGIKTYARHNLFGRQYGIYAEVSKTNSNTSYAGYFKGGHSDTNGYSRPRVVYIDQQTSIGANNHGFSIGCYINQDDYIKNQFMRWNSGYSGTSTQTALSIRRGANNNGPQIGSITTTTSSTSYNTSSDYRLKENVTDVTDGITRLKQLAPKRFNFTAEPDKVVDGFIAHEAQTVVPEAVTGTHDGMVDEEYEVTPAVLDDDGNVVTEAVMGIRSVPDYQGIDQSKLVPLLTAALQEAITKIEQLEARVATLEG